MANTLNKRLLTQGLYQLGDFNAGLAHEINNPLAILIGQLSIMKMMLEKGKLTEEKLAEKLTKLEDATQRVIDIVESMRKIPRSVNSKELVPVPLNDILDVASFLIAYPCKKADVSYTCPQVDESIFLLCIWEEIVVVLNSLLKSCVDSIKDMEDNKFITLEVSSTQHQVSLSIKCNHSPDILPELLEICQDIFAQYEFDLLWEKNCFSIAMPICDQQSAA